MEVIEGCDSAKDFSIKAPLCVQRSSGEGYLLATPGDQSWKTQLSNSSIIGRRFNAPVLASMHFSFLCFCLNQYHIRTRAHARTHTSTGRRAEQNTAALKGDTSDPGLQRGSCDGGGEDEACPTWFLQHKNIKRKGKTKGTERRKRGKRKRSALHLVLSTVNIIFTYKVPTKGFLSVWFPFKQWKQTETDRVNVLKCKIKLKKMLSLPKH